MVLNNLYPIALPDTPQTINITITVNNVTIGDNNASSSSINPEIDPKTLAQILSMFNHVKQ